MTFALALSLCVATSASAATLTLQWDPASNAAEVAGYVVMYGRNPGAYTATRHAGLVTTFTVTGLAAGTRYCFAVQAYDSNGLVSDPSVEVCGTTPAGPPTDPTDPPPTDPPPTDPPPTDPPPTTDERAPYGGAPAAVPGRIEAAHFDDGPAGVAFRDLTSGNAGSAFRATDVDLEPDAAGGHSVGWIESGEWLTYSVDVATAGAYVATFRVGSAGDGSVTLSFDGSDAQATIDVPNTGGQQTWATVSVPITLRAGHQIMRVAFTSAGFGFRSVSLDRVGATLRVDAGDNLQAAIDAARPGDTILLTAGATFRGNFVLRKKTGATDAYVTIRSSASDSVLPVPGARMTPSYASRLPKLLSPNTRPALGTEPGAHHYRLQFLEFGPTKNADGTIIALGDDGAGQSSLDAVPYEIVLDRVYVHGDPARGQARALALNSASTQLLDSYISEIKSEKTLAQAIGGWNGPGPFLIANNYLEAAGHNVAFGVSEPAAPELTPSDISLWRNQIAKKLAWRSQAWRAASLLELRNAERVVVEGNVLENSWEAAASLSAGAGFAVRMYSANTAGGPAWSRVRDVVFRHNTVRNVSSGMYIARDASTPDGAVNITVKNNLFDKVSGALQGGFGAFLVLAGASDVTVDHNTVFSDGEFGVVGMSWPTARLTFTNNVMVDRGAAISSGYGKPGTNAIAQFFAGSEFRGGIFVAANPTLYPAGNNYPVSIAAVKFVDYAKQDYRLKADSLYRLSGTDGTDPGTDFAALAAAQR